jgi:uncharacterized Zn finger protein
MSYVESGQFPSTSRGVRSQCPDCPGNLSVMRVIGGRAGSEYWTLRCTRCGGIQLDIVHPHAHGDAPAA